MKLVKVVNANGDFEAAAATYFNNVEKNTPYSLISMTDLLVLFLDFIFESF